MKASAVSASFPLGMKIESPVDEPVFGHDDLDFLREQESAELGFRELRARYLVGRKPWQGIGCALCRVLQAHLCPEADLPLRNH